MLIFRFVYFAFKNKKCKTQIMDKLVMTFYFYQHIIKSFSLLNLEQISNTFKT